MKTRLCHNKHQCYLGWFDNDWHEIWISVFMQMRRKMCNRLKTKISQRERLLFSLSRLEVYRNQKHYNDVIMFAMASQITSLTIDYSTVNSWRRSKKTSKLYVTGLVRGIHRRPVNSPNKGPVTWKMFSFDDVIMNTAPGLYPHSTHPF